MAPSAVRDQAQAAIVDLHETVTKLRSADFSFQNIADLLNAQGHTTRRGNPGPTWPFCGCASGLDVATKFSRRSGIASSNLEGLSVETSPTCLDYRHSRCA